MVLDLSSPLGEELVRLPVTHTRLGFKPSPVGSRKSRSFHQSKGIKPASSTLCPDVRIFLLADLRWRLLHSLEPGSSLFRWNSFNSPGSGNRGYQLQTVWTSKWKRIRKEELTRLCWKVKGRNQDNNFGQRFVIIWNVLSGEISGKPYVSIWTNYFT